MTARLAAEARRAAREAAYLALGTLTGTLAAVLWPVGLGLSFGLGILLVGLPVAILTANVFRGVAELDRLNARWVLAQPIVGSYRPRGPGLRRLVTGTLGDPQTWRDLAWLVVHSMTGMVLGWTAFAAIAATLGLLVLPAWVWAVPDGVDVGVWRFDTVAEGFLGTLLAVPAGLVTAALLRAFATAQSAIAQALLGAPADAGERAPAPAQTRRAPWDPTDGIVIHLLVAVVAVAGSVVLWALTGFGYPWPLWILLAVAITVSFHVVAARAVLNPGRRLGASVDVSVVASGICLAVWALSGFGYVWPVWPIFGMAVGVGLHALVEYRHELPWVRERRLVQRVEELTRTRAGALDVQAEELRRIERDLHDGAQARLVSLSMLVGRAEAQLDDRPDVAELVRRARDEAGAAIRELRDLARGIAPPVLADRGLVAAVESLAARSPMEVTVEAGSIGRLAPAIETAAYFVVAEALTNAAKHGGGAPATVRLERRRGVLRVEVADSGPGGADPARGSGLAGLRSRVAALDGSLGVASPAGAGTTVVAELPCGS